MTGGVDTPRGGPPTGGHRRPFGPRLDTFVPGVRPSFLHVIAPRPVPFRRGPVAVPDTVEVVFLARARPVRLRLTVTAEGQPLSKRADAVLHELFAAFDRDGDGFLNEAEVELIFAKVEVKNLLAYGSGGFRGANATTPTLLVLDKDDDGRVSFDEFADYYAAELGNLLRVQPANAATQPDAATGELFARLDANKDGKLSAAELKDAEKLLLPLDSDEDECVAAAELLVNPLVAKVATLAGAGGGDGMMMRGPNDRPSAAANPDLLAFVGHLPGAVVQQVIKRYDRDGDSELTREEIGFDDAAFAALDTNKDGKLSATELDGWLVGEPDATAAVDVADTPQGCTVAAAAGKGPRGIAVPKAPSPDRVVLRADRQTVDVGATAPPAGVRQQPPGSQYAYLFPKGKKYLEEKELDGPQNQFLRILFEPADFDGDGRLTLDELTRYEALQRAVAKVGVSVAYSVRTPDLFQLLDADGDGKLSVRELRTAYDRLHPLEPSDGPDVTRAVLQPAVVIRGGAMAYGMSDPALYARSPYSPVASPAPARGPAWFRKADRNGDGDVSRAEFLGSKADFDRIDADHDGLITLTEAEAFDAKTRGK